MPEVELPPSLNSEEAVEGRPSSTDLGKRVVFFSSQDKREKFGVLRYLGVPEFAEGLWCGVELDEPQGRNNGSIHGIRYFSCEPDFGVFVPLAKVELDLSRKAQVKQVRKNNAALSKEMANRMGQPAFLGTRKISHHGVTNWRQPMKAFAPNGMTTDSTQQRRGQAVLPPFRAGGIYKAVSTENIRSLKDRNGSGQSAVKKSSSERDLRSGKLSGRPQQPGSPLRVSSASNLAAPPRHTRHGSLDSSASPPPPMIRIWPKTSTPGVSRDDSSPDGCSSPESSDSCSSSSLSREEDSPLPSTNYLTGSGVSSGADIPSPAGSIGSAECAFLKTPDSAKPADSESPITPAPSHHAGLATHLTQFVQSTKTASKISGDCRVPSPERESGQPRYRNSVSGPSTLSHPLSLATNAEEGENGVVSNGSGGDSHLFELLLNSRNTTEEVSASDLLQLFRHQYSNWHSAQVQLENKISCLEKELDSSRRELCDVRTSCQRKLQEAESRHKQEVRQLTLKLQKAHRRIMEGSGEHHHTTV